MVRIDKIIKVTAGGFHCWVESDVGLIRKPNHAVPQELWDIFEGRRKVAEIKISRWQKLWLKIKEIFWKIFGMKH